MTDESKGSGKVGCLDVLQWLFCLICCCSGLPSLFSGGSEPESTASVFVDNFLAPTAENQRKWGLSDVQLLGVPRKQVTVEKVGDSPETHEAVINVWCQGKNASGTVVKRQRTLTLKLLKEEGKPMQVQSHEFTSDEELSFGRQLLSWLVVAALGPVVVCIIGLIKLRARLRGEGGWGLLSLVLVLASVAWAGYATYAIFDSYLGSIGFSVLLLAGTFLAAVGIAGHVAEERRLSGWNG
jgi:hypothetical protein